MQKSTQSTQKITVTQTGRILRGEEKIARHRRHDAPELQAAVQVVNYLQKRDKCLYPTPNIGSLGELADVIALALGTATEADIPPPPPPLTEDEIKFIDSFIDN